MKNNPAVKYIALTKISINYNKYANKLYTVYKMFFKNVFLKLECVVFAVFCEGFFIFCFFNGVWVFFIFRFPVSTLLFSSFLVFCVWV